MINEANSISEELGKSVSFEVKVIAATALVGDASSLQKKLSIQASYEAPNGEREDVIWERDDFMTRLLGENPKNH